MQQQSYFVCFCVIVMCPLYQTKVDRAFDGGPDHEVLVNAFNASLTRRDLKVIESSGEPNDLPRKTNLCPEEIPREDIVPPPPRANSPP